jgi:hypothetical protein
MSQVPRKLVVVPCAGLCNRVQTMVCGQLFAEDTSREFFLNWYPTDTCGVTFDELFLASFPSLHDLPEDAVLYSSLRQQVADALPEPLVERLASGAELRFTKLRRDRSAVIAIFSCHQFLSYFHDPRFAPAVRELFRHVRPEITSAVEEFKKSFFTEETIGVHLRRTDWRSQKGLDYFLGQMSRFPEATFFVSSDDPATFDEIRRHCDRAVEYPKSSLSRGDRDGITQALIDLLLLAGTSYLIGTPGSSFSAFARIIGDVPGNFRYGFSVSVRDLRLGNLSNLGSTLARRLVRSVRSARS